MKYFLTLLCLFSSAMVTYADAPDVSTCTIQPTIIGADAVRSEKTSSYSVTMPE